MWYMCFLCMPIPVRYGRPFTNVRWYERLDSEFCKKKARHHEHLELNKAASADKGDLVSEKSMLELKLASRAQTSMGAFLEPREKSMPIW